MNVASWNWKDPLHLDMFRQKRLVINRVSLNAFRLTCSEEGAAYVVQMLDASCKLCLQ